MSGVSSSSVLSYFACVLNLCALRILEGDPWPEWCAAVAKRFSAKHWAERLAKKGITELPAARDGIVDFAARHFIAQDRSFEPLAAGCA